MRRLMHPETNMASNQDWLRASKEMTISAYEPRTTTLPTSVSTALEPYDSPFAAAHPSVAGRRNVVRASDEESITLGRAQEVHPRQHANARTLLHAKKHR